mgnify:CR=1 FL=1
MKTYSYKTLSESMFIDNAKGGNTKVEVVHRWDTDGHKSVEFLMNDVTCMMFSNSIFKDYQDAVKKATTLLNVIASSDGTITNEED